MTRFKRRNYMELRVGEEFTVDVIIYLDPRTLRWFKQKSSFAESEVLRTIQESIIPRLFETEIDREVDKADEELDKSIPALGEGGVRLPSPEKRPSKSRKRKKKTKKELAEEKRREAEQARLNNEQMRDIYYAQGKHIELAYRTKDLERDQSASFVFGNEKEDANASKSPCPLAHLRKLRKRVLIWCFQKSDFSSLDEKKQAIFRQDVVPISSLFRLRDIA